MVRIELKLKKKRRENVIEGKGAERSCMDVAFRIYLRKIGLLFGYKGLVGIRYNQ